MFRESFTHLICPRHPRCGRQSRYWEVHQRQVANLLHRNLTSAGYSAGCAFRLQKYHCPASPVIALHGVQLRFTRSIAESLPPLSREIMARLSDLACPLIADRTGNVLMKWYSVLVCYEVKLVSSPIRTKIGQIIGYPEKIFLFFQSGFYALISCIFAFFIFAFSPYRFYFYYIFVGSKADKSIDFYAFVCYNKSTS